MTAPLTPREAAWRAWKASHKKYDDPWIDLMAALDAYEAAQRTQHAGLARTLRFAAEMGSDDAHLMDRAAAALEGK